MKKLFLLIMAFITIGVVMAQEVPENWELTTTDFTVTEETNGANISEGSSACIVNWTSQTTQKLRSDDFAVSEGQAIVLSLDVIDNDNQGRTRVGIGFGEDFITWTEGVGSTAYSSDQAGYQTLTLSGITVPAGYTTAYLEIRFYDESSNWVDNATNTIDNMIVTLDGGANVIANGGFETWGTPVLEPALDITYPADASTVSTADLDVTFTVENFVLGTDGKVKYSVDGGADVFVTTADPISLTGLTEASHTVTMELVDMLEASLDPVVTASTTFTVDLSAPAYTPVYDIQYTEDPTGDSDLADQSVTTMGVVSGINGDKFWLQDGAGAWNGVYVYYTTTPGPAVGDSVEVNGTVVEYNNLTEISPVATMTVINSGNTVADAAELATGSVGVEDYEGVLVTVTGTCTNADAGYGMFELNDGSGAILVDDVMYAATVVAGNSYTVTGLVDYSFSEWKILPREAADVIDNGASTTPLLTITSPANSATVYTANVDVEFSVSNFVLGTDGQVAWDVDGGTTAYVTSSPIAVTDLTDGSHTVNLELVDMSNNPLATPVTASVTFTVDLSGPTYTSIYDIQNGSATGDVWVRAVVSANFNGSDYGEGYYIQQGGGAWNGIYVYDLVNTPAIGDSVEIAASIDEYYDMTQLESVTSYTVVGVEGTVAAPTVVSNLDAATEQYESVLVKVSNAECTEIQNAYGEWYVNDGTGALMCKDNGVFDFTEALGTNYNIIGVMAYSYGEFSINYRIESDITISSSIESELTQNVSVYPNPTSNFVNIATDAADYITITNLVGQVVKEISVKNEIETISTNELNSGVYFVEITKANETATVKLIVE